MFLERNELIGKKNKVMVGYDLGNQFSQISYCFANGEEPETISLVAGGQQYNFPTVLGKRLEVNQWIYGKDACKMVDKGEGILVDRLLERAREGTQVILGEDSFDPVALLALFLKRSLSLLNMIVSPEQVDIMMITVEKLDHRTIEVLTQATEVMNLKAKQICFQSHIESFYNYTIHQPPELWKYQVLVCDFTGTELKTYRLECNKKTTPVVAFVDTQKFPQIAGEETEQEQQMTQEQLDAMDQELLAAVREICNGRILSSVYLLGKGYDENWCRESLRFLCKGRRVFQGNNLYSKGACYGALEKRSTSEIGQSYVFLGNEKLKANLGIKVLKQDREAYYPLLDAGINWFEAKCECEFILESGHSFSLILTPLNGKDAREIEIILDNMPERRNRATRIRMVLSMKAENIVDIQMEDLGFGEIYPASGQNWKEEFQI